MSVPVCILTEEDVDLWITDKKRPDCRTHRHMSKKQASEYTDPRASYQGALAKIVGANAIQMTQSKTWKTVYVGKSENGAPGMPTKQYVYGDVTGKAGSVHYKGGIGACGAKDMAARMNVRATNKTLEEAISEREKTERESTLVA